MKIKSVGSVCSGIEAASVAWKHLNYKFEWFSEIADFPSRLLSEKYPNTPNLGDMNKIPDLIKLQKIQSPDLICGGTPCQAFSYAGWMNGLNDDRGNLTIKFVDIINENDKIRNNQGLDPSIVFWENVEGVLIDKTNAFGCFISSLAGFDNVLERKKWPSSGIIKGPIRNIAWRVLDAKYFGLPQQRKRLYLLAGGTNFNPENVLFEYHKGKLKDFPKSHLVFEKDGHHFEVFREYTDCLYSAYGTKWNGNAASFNGSLFIAQNNKLRRLSPLETERLMGFPDNYTNIPKAKKTNRYQAVGNSWAIPVIKWIGDRLEKYNGGQSIFPENDFQLINRLERVFGNYIFIDCGKDIIKLSNNLKINCTNKIEESYFTDIREIVSIEAPEDIYISPVGCYGILRRKLERGANINPRLELILTQISSQMDPNEIEKRSLVQKRGQLSSNYNQNSFDDDNIRDDLINQISLFERD